jgi:hypothetical protein
MMLKNWRLHAFLPKVAPRPRFSWTFDQRPGSLHQNGYEREMKPITAFNQTEYLSHWPVTRHQPKARDPPARDTPHPISL